MLIVGVRDDGPIPIKILLREEFERVGTLDE